MSQPIQPLPESAAPPVGGQPSPRAGAFTRLRTRWLILWALAGTVIVMVIVESVRALVGDRAADDLFGVLAYVPIILWLWVAVVRRAGVDLRVMLRWPRLGKYWWVVAGLFVGQYLFSVAAVTLTQIVVPDLTDALEGVGEGNLVMAAIGLVILPPLVEEIVFRGVFIERFTVKWRVGVAVIVSAVFFGILHVDPVGAGMFGVITALLYLRTGSLWPGIVIHFANNLVALVAMRLAPDVEAEPLAVDDALLAAAVLLALSLPFIGWFIRANWPRRGARTPYQQYEQPDGPLPDRVDSVSWSGAPGLVRLEVSTTHLALARGEPGSGPFALLPLERIHACYASPVPGGEQVVLLLQDGSWTTLGVAGYQPAAARELAALVSERVTAARAVALPPP